MDQRSSFRIAPAALLAACLALGLAACGSSAGNDAADDGALNPSGTASASASASASVSSIAAAAASASVMTTASDANVLQSFPFPSDVKIEFETPLPASGTARQVMIGYENYVDASWYAIYTHGKDTTYEKYDFGDALTATQELISTATSENLTLRGTIVYFDMSVTQTFGVNSGVAQACFDVSNFDAINAATGANNGPVYNDDYYLEQTAVGDSGSSPSTYWIVSDTQTFLPSSGGAAAMCE